MEDGRAGSRGTLLNWSLTITPAGPSGPPSGNSLWKADAGPRAVDEVFASAGAMRGVRAGAFDSRRKSD